MKVSEEHIGSQFRPREVSDPAELRSIDGDQVVLFSHGHHYPVARAKFEQEYRLRLPDPLIPRQALVTVEQVRAAVMAAFHHRDQELRDLFSGSDRNLETSRLLWQEVEDQLQQVMAGEVPLELEAERSAK